MAGTGGGMRRVWEIKPRALGKAMVEALVGVLDGHGVQRQWAMVEKLIVFLQGGFILGTLMKWLIGCINETWCGYHSLWLSLREDSLTNLKAVFPMARGITMIGVNMVLGILERLLSGVVEFNRAAMLTVTAVASSSGNNDPGKRSASFLSQRENQEGQMLSVGFRQSNSMQTEFDRSFANCRQMDGMDQRLSALYGDSCHFYVDSKL
ncbi:hypothetical protein NE237_002606 [Protea cynaroides]|uniref:Uncharacterized protein n=1 Tax=Protea cynaroides TaxID=273540 RepID=A0A9Q0QZ70_9MAGN|nr:hypothetical protein NE237_002606 [Protea cynaroides]